MTTQPEQDWDGLLQRLANKLSIKGMADQRTWSQIERAFLRATPEGVGEWKKDIDLIRAILDRAVMATRSHLVPSQVTHALYRIEQALSAAPPKPAPDAVLEVLEPFRKFVSAREGAWKNIKDDSAFYGEKYPGHNLTIGDFRRLVALSAPVPSPDGAAVSIKPMQLSDDRTDYFVSIKVGDREVTPHVFREEYKAAYHVALYDWLLNGAGEEPDVVEFSPNDWPARSLSHRSGRGGRPQLRIAEVPICKVQDERRIGRRKRRSPVRGDREAIRKIVDAWDTMQREQLQLDEGVEQAIEAGRDRLKALTADQAEEISRRAT